MVGLSREQRPGFEHDRFTFEPVDFAARKSVDLRLKELSRKYNNASVLVSNAGQGFFGGLEQFSPQQIRESMDVNLTSHLLLTRAFLPVIRSMHVGDIVYMGSEGANQGGKQGSLYCAAKFGLKGFAQSIRQDTANAGVRVGIVNPGMVRTEFFDKLRFEPGEQPDQAIEPADVADAVMMMPTLRQGTVLDEINLSPQTKVMRTK